MAGIKITELPPSGTIEKNDLTYLVDVTDNTSKSATIQNIIEAVDQVGITDGSGYAVLQATDSFGLKVKSDNGSFQGLYYNDDYSANYTDSSLIARKDAPLIIRENGTPCLNNNIPVRLGDLYFDHGGGDLYYAYDTTDCSNWRKLSSATSGYYVPAVVSIAITGQTIDFIGNMFWNNVDGLVNCKGRFELTMNPLHNYSFVINLPVIPPSGFSINYQIIGSVVPYGTNTLNHKVNHTSVYASGSYTGAEFYIEVDNSMNGLCQFVYDFSYLVI